MPQNNNKPKSFSTWEDYLLSVLLSLAGGLSFFLVVLVGGSLMFPETWIVQPAETPARSNYQRPVATATHEPVSSATEPQDDLTIETTPSESESRPDESPIEQEPKEQPTAVMPEVKQTENTSPVSTSEQRPSPSTSKPGTEPNTSQIVSPTVQIPTSTQSASSNGGGSENNQSSGNKGGSSGQNVHDFSGGRVLITTASNNNNDPVYHTRDCSAAKKISPQDAAWFDSEDAAKADGRRLCGLCAKGS